MGVKLRLRKYKSGASTYYLDIYHNGSRWTEFLKLDKSLGKKVRKELADEIRTKRHEELISEDYDIIPKFKREVSFNSFYRVYLDRYVKKDKRMVRYAFEKFMIFRGKSETKFKDLNEKLIEDFKDFLIDPDQSGLTGETPYDYFARFKRVIKTAYKEGLMNTKKFNGIISISIKRRQNQLKKNVLETGELKKLYNTPCTNPEIKRAFLFACYTGLGCAEIRKLTWDRINNGKIKLFREKDDEQVINDLPLSALKILGSKPVNAEMHIFKLPSDVAVRNSLKVWIKKAGITKHISFYCARHTFATQLLIHTRANLKTVANLMGHTTTKHTEKYLNYVDQLKTDAISSLPELN